MIFFVYFISTLVYQKYVRYVILAHKFIQNFHLFYNVFSFHLKKSTFFIFWFLTKYVKLFKILFSTIGVEAWKIKQAKN